MKIIEAMKQIRSLNEKCVDLLARVKQNCANLDIETPQYQNPGQQVTEWIQSYHDSVKEISRLRTAIQRTNLATKVAVTLGGVTVTKTIAEWVHRRRDLAKMELNVWSALSDRGLKEGSIASSTGGEPRMVKIVRHFDTKERDVKMSLYRDEPHVIDATLEVVNATTDLME